MAPLSTVDDVRAVAGTGLGVSDIEVFLLEAAAWVALNLADDDLDEDSLRIIETRLTAFFITSREAQRTSVAHADIKETYQRDAKTSEHLRIAMGFDPTGKVRAAFLNQDGRLNLIAVTGPGYAG